jgi:hypothetical protein
VYHVGLDPDKRTSQPVPELVAHAAVRCSEVDPRDPMGDSAGPIAGGERDRFDAELREMAKQRDLVAADAPGHRLQQLTGVHRNLHSYCSATRR